MLKFQNIFHLPNEQPLHHKIITYGAFRQNQLQNICGLEIRQQSLRQMITNTLKLCYLFQPIIKGLKQINNSRSALIKVSDILKVLTNGLFYRYMIKFNLENDVTVALVNSRFTHINVNVIIAALIVYISKKLSLDQIASAMLIFNLEEALMALRPFGLPLDSSNLYKILKKIQRAIHINDLKRFIAVCKQQKDSNYLEPDQFLFLTAISRRKSVNSVIFFQRKQLRNLMIPDINVEAQEEKSKEDNKVIPSQVAREKVRGLSMHTPGSNDKLKRSITIFKDIKNCLYHKRRAKSVKLEAQLKKNPRPQSAYFRKSVHLFKQSIQVQNLMEKEKQNLDRFKLHDKKQQVCKKKNVLKLKGTACRHIV